MQNVQSIQPNADLTHEIIIAGELKLKMLVMHLTISFYCRYTETFLNYLPELTQLFNKNNRNAFI